MKYGCLLLVALVFCATSAQAGTAAWSDTIESRMAGTNPHGQDAPVPAEEATVVTEAHTLSVPEPAPDIALQHPPVVKAGILSSDSGDYQYEAMAPGAEKETLPELLPPAQFINKIPVIAIVIDDMGVDRKHSARAVKLPPSVTLSYLPYSTHIREQTDAAKKAGHELLVHMPMQPDRATADPGPDYLGTAMSPGELHSRIERNLGAFTGYVGINNHMGSKFTCDKEGLDVVMAALEERKLMFLDSRTSPASVAEKIARAHRLETSHRDVFIDDDESAAAVAKSLKRIESVARHAGAAIAIGHPKDVTLSALEKWLPSLKEKGFELVTVSRVIELRNGKRPAVASAEAKAEPAPVPVPEASPATVAPVVAPEVQAAPAPEVQVTPAPLGPALPEPPIHHFRPSD